MDLKIGDTNEAAYYFQNKQRLEGVSIRKNKQGYDQWIFHFPNIQVKYVERWRQNDANVNLRQYLAARRSLKRAIKRMLRQ